MFSSQKGFTLIEAMVAIFIIAVAVIGVVVGFSSGLATVQELEQISVADKIAQEKMESLRGGAPLVATSQPESIQREGTVYYCTVSVSPVSGATALSEVTVLVNFTSRTGRNITRRLSTYFAEDGITKSQS